MIDRNVSARSLISISPPTATPTGFTWRLDNGQAGLFGTFAVVMLVVVVVIGLVLGLSFRAQASKQGLAEGRAEAVLMAQTAVGPVLSGQSLSQGLSAEEVRDMNRLTAKSIKSGHVLRLRLRDLSGTIEYSTSGERILRGASESDRHEIAEAASGAVVGRLTTLNADDDSGPSGPAVVEVYLPVMAGSSAHRVGVLEVYLPYAPIRKGVNAGLANLYRLLALGLALLYLVLVAISSVVGRRLRRQVQLTTYVSEHDVLTGLPNRGLFMQLAAAELERGRAEGLSVAVAVLDLDRFKEINDTLGHNNGDALLAALSSVMLAHLPEGSALARLGGDEFGFIFRDDAVLELSLELLRSTIAAEVLIDGIPLSVETSIGYAVAPNDGVTLDELLPLAEIAMYAAKEHHVGVAKYDVAQSQFVASDLALMADLRLAIDNDELVLHYQPQISVLSGQANAVEALVRWNHPTDGLIYPDSFIGLAEKTDLIDCLTEWVVRRALADVSRFDESGTELRVSVNISARNLNKPGFAASIVRALATSHVAPDRLILEVTETALMTDPQRAARSFERLGAAGVHLSIDDFGVGQTSLSYLSTLPVTEIKIDRSFVTDMRQDKSHEAIVRAIIYLGHNLGFRVVGEGVEDATVYQELSAAGCDVAQGYHFARPMTFEALGEWLASHSAPVLVR